jgi:hypothetical protein
VDLSRSRALLSGMSAMLASLREPVVDEALLAAAEPTTPGKRRCAGAMVERLQQTRARAERSGTHAHAPHAQPWR